MLTGDTLKCLHLPLGFYKSENYSVSGVLFDLRSDYGILESDFLLSGVFSINYTTSKVERTCSNFEISLD